MSVARIHFEIHVIKFVDYVHCIGNIRIDFTTIVILCCTLLYLYALFIRCTCAGHVKRLAEILWSLWCVHTHTHARVVNFQCCVYMYLYVYMYISHFGGGGDNGITEASSNNHHHLSHCRCHRRCHCKILHTSNAHINFETLCNTTKCAYNGPFLLPYPILCLLLFFCTHITYIYACLFVCV